MQGNREKNPSRRRFFEAAAGTAFGVVTAGIGNRSHGGLRNRVRVGLIGVGRRGTSLLKTILALEDVEVPALCDIDRQAAERGVGILEKAGRGKTETYTRNELDYRRLLQREDLDAVVIATYWQWHARMAVDAMLAGKYVGVEVPAALSIEECWALVDTSEKTGVPCMMLENWSFRRDNLALLNMVRQGLFGEVVHCHCAHSHDCVDHWFFYEDGRDRWPAEFLVKYNRDQYPTHSQGPVLGWMDINCGDAYKTIVSTASASRGINDFFVRKFGPDHPNAKRKFKQGDIVTSILQTHRGKTLVINYDMQLPRPYDNRWMLQGTRGIYNEQRDAVYFVDRSPRYHKWESFKPYQSEFEHSWWKKLLDRKAEKLGHGGTDYLELELFFQAVREKTQTPLDVYDSVTMSSIVPLSGISIERRGAPVECPDFTRGKWKTRKPYFALV